MIVRPAEPPVGPVNLVLLCTTSSGPPWLAADPLAAAALRSLLVKRRRMPVTSPVASELNTLLIPPSET
jgi:hypothetical protein